MESGDDRIGGNNERKGMDLSGDQTSQGLRATAALKLLCDSSTLNMLTKLDESELWGICRFLTPAWLPMYVHSVCWFDPICIPW